MKQKHILLYSILIFGFTLGIHRGRLALWKDGSREPVEIYPIYAAHMPEEDRRILENGIRAETLSALTAILEDYLS